MSDGYFVDLSAMHAAIEGIQQTLDAVSVSAVKDIDPPPDSFGHEGLGDAVAEFCERWDLGVGHLAGDAAEVGDRLRVTAATYEQADALSMQAIAPSGTSVQGSGADPAAAAAP
jgi:hypothetical protein